MNKYVFQLESGEEFTIPAQSPADAWQGAIAYLIKEGMINDLTTLTCNGMA